MDNLTKNNASVFDLYSLSPIASSIKVVHAFTTGSNSCNIIINFKSYVRFVAGNHRIDVGFAKTESFSKDQVFWKTSRGTRMPSH